MKAEIMRETANKINKIINFQNHHFIFISFPLLRKMMAARIITVIDA